MAYRVTIPGNSSTEMEAGAPIEASPMFEGPVTSVTAETTTPLPSDELRAQTAASDSTSLRLDPKAVRERLGQDPDEHDLAILRFDVLAALASLKGEIHTGRVAPHPLLVQGLPLGDWLPLDTLARLLRTSRTP
jgi:hypothetical protein